MHDAPDERPDFAVSNVDRGNYATISGALSSPTFETLATASNVQHANATRFLAVHLLLMAGLSALVTSHRQGPTLLQPHRMRLALAVLLISALAGCSTTPAPSPMADGPDDPIIYVVGRDWHTDIAVPASELTGPLGGLERVFPGAQYFSFGFGERRYVLAHDKTFGDMLLALWPGPGLMLVTGLRAPPSEAFGSAHVVPLRVSETGLKALLTFVGRYFGLGTGGDLRLVANGPYPGSVFFASSGTYGATYTCNTWTADALRTAGLPVEGDGVLFAAQVMKQAREVNVVQTRDVAARGRSGLLQSGQADN